jgi:four helix bundle protein
MKYVYNMIRVAKINSFKDFDAFRKCRDFAKVVGGLLRTAKCSNDPELVHQTRKASISILSNFAEGYERNGNKEFVQFLAISKGSVGEVRAQLIWALDQGYLADEQYNTADRLGEEATRLLGGLMAYLSRSGISGTKFLKTAKSNPKPQTLNSKL